MTTPRNRTHLAELLGIAKSAVTAQAARGMPTDSLEAAQAWRKAKIDPARKKGSRLDKFYQPRQPAPPAPLPDAVAHANELMEIADAALQAGHAIWALVPGLRAAMRAVPVPERESVALYLPVMKLLLKHVLDVMPAKDGNPVDRDGDPIYCNGADLSDEEANSVGADWYQIAAGELEFDLDTLAQLYGTATP